MRKINCYGRPFEPDHFEPVLQPYRIIKENNITYLVFGDYEKGVIHKIDRSNTDQIILSWTYGKVVDRATLDYVSLNDYIEV